MKNNSLTPFSKEDTETLLGARVRKLVLEEANPSVRIGQIGTVIKYEEADLTDGYAIEVDWGDNETWVYECKAGFEEDVEVLPDSR